MIDTDKLGLPDDAALEQLRTWRQAVDKRYAEIKEFRISADYAEVEQRVLAQNPETEELSKAIQNGFDVHRETAAKLFNVPPEAVTPDQRKAAKVANFRHLYGGTKNLPRNSR